MKKRVLSALLAAALTLSLVTPALAVTSQDDAAQALAALDIMTGDESGNLNLSAPVTRAEFVKMLMAASPISVGDVTYVSPYPDVPASHWAAPYVEAAVTAGYVTGYLDGTFRPSNTITLAEGVVMALRLLGYTNEDFSGSFPAGQMAMYRTLDLDEGITIGQNDTMTRQDAMYLFYNLLTAPSKTTGQPYLSSVLGYSLTADGDVDTLALLNGTMDGPVVVGEVGWRDKIPFDISKASVTRNGVVTTSAALTDNDVVYWSKHLNALWVYTNKITGPIQAITPASAPTSVTVSGKSYEIETSTAAYALSDLGTFEVGDSVTLLLGRDGKVAAVAAPGQTSGGSVCGLVVSNVPQQYTDKNGNDYTAASVTILATDGNTYTYSTERTSVRTGTLVQAVPTENGMEVKNLSSASLSGKVNADGTKLGGRSFASNVEILDTYGDHGVRVYPERLAGMEITESMVRYYLLDGNGDISRLILKDATGDMHTYGVITSVSEVNSSASMTTAGTYVYDTAGTTKTISGSTVYNVKTGPFMMKTDGEEIDRLTNLTEVKITSVEGTTAYAGNRQYAIWDDALVYEVRDGKYYLTSLALVTGGDYTLTGWYDKDQTDGGRIRVILAK
ncbi:S-layer homology domain-containing protein [Intestinimonas timonensis]|uniref:S-layer homology domain-containing protein n=1 Tax=Intestinimonas timonensis TaxID=1689270 RepID=UPI00102F47D2|nr:S-layer homology domain-containing protein [Intestinimonas timonensis]